MRSLIECMNINKPSAHPDSPRRALLARYPLTFYFIIAYVGTWLVWSLFVLSQNGAGLLPFRSPMLFPAAPKMTDTACCMGTLASHLALE
jgi:hypothetical protein